MAVDIPPSTMAGMTQWHIEDGNGELWQVSVVGENGRISYNGGQRGYNGEVRFYRTATAKNFDAVIPNVTRIWSQNVMVTPMGKTRAAKEADEERAKYEKERFDRAIEAVLKGKSEPEEEEAW